MSRNGVKYKWTGGKMGGKQKSHITASRVVGGVCCGGLGLWGVLWGFLVVVVSVVFSLFLVGCFCACVVGFGFFFCLVGGCFGFFPPPSCIQGGCSALEHRGARRVK